MSELHTLLSAREYGQPIGHHGATCSFLARELVVAIALEINGVERTVDVYPDVLLRHLRVHSRRDQMRRQRVLDPSA